MLFRCNIFDEFQNSMIFDTNSELCVSCLRPIHFSWLCHQTENNAITQSESDSESFDF